MQNYLLRIKKIKKQLVISNKERFVAAPDGTNYKVFLSDSYVIRFRDDNSKLLLREVDFLKQHNFTLIPKILWFGEIDQSFFMIENRLPGKTINLVWKNLSTKNKNNIIEQVIKFLQYQKTQTKNCVYSVKTGKKYKKFLDYLMDGVKQKVANIKKFQQTNKMIGDLLLIIDNLGVKNLFTIKTKTTLVHGDLIIHNLLTDGKNLTGVLDWGMALWGDSDYDLFRLFYYQECAKAYQEQGTDEIFESDYMDRLIATILKSDLVKNKKLFQKKYQLVRAIFYINTLYWATNSDSPKKNINEILMKWDKKSGIKYLRI
ncbi:aminoglycoside phosphotransferase family protein [bacterium]|nr:aminoglycoside phosphotransferase family protein [bacterium]